MGYAYHEQSDLCLPKAVSSCLLKGLHQSLSAAQMPGTALPSLTSALKPLYPLFPSPKQSCPGYSQCVSALPKPLCLIFSLNQLFAALPSLASSTHFINMLFTSACRSLATILNNWQFAQEAAISGVDDLFYFPFLREQQKQQRWVDVERTEPRAEMREALCLPLLLNLSLCFVLTWTCF